MRRRHNRCHARLKIDSIPIQHIAFPRQNRSFFTHPYDLSLKSHWVSSQHSLKMRIVTPAQCLRTIRERPVIPTISIGFPASVAPHPESTLTPCHEGALRLRPPRVAVGKYGDLLASGPQNATAHLSRILTEDPGDIPYKLRILSVTNILHGRPKCGRYSLLSLFHRTEVIWKQSTTNTIHNRLTYQFFSYGVCRNDMDEGFPKNSKQYWGPIVWRIFHLLSEISDKHEVIPLWKKWFGQTADIMPCEKCRVHLHQYLRTHPFLKLQSFKRPQEAVRNHVREEIMKLHNYVNEDTGKPVFTQDKYLETYGAKTRQEILLETQNLLQDLESAWLPMEYFLLRKGEYAHWKNSFVLLRAILQ